ncbi:MAG TPA: DNA/RNA non-specific endonuclease [Kiritimatiellia bacterium]|nr:DNA/RNA non-specific endonuclease [Kiritimatiellia bacterium]HRR33139.1 DNA/RNA non-specific endonuclease [Kiritimatiellia bacterium]HRU70230.1 DNA/RNA non-specific endonuclease [Kiritimatiellia bacterium]
MARYRLANHCVRWIGLLLVLTVLATNWYVHQPRYWQQVQAQYLPPPLAEWVARIGNASADLTDALGLTGRDVEVPYPTPLPSSTVTCAGLPKRTGEPAPAEITVLHKTGFVVGYSPALRHPLWAAYRTYPKAYAELPPRPSGFKPDPQAKRSPQHKEYTKSGYDRGHLVPNLAIASRYGKAAQLETFLTSNICPQRPSLNRGPWYELEYRISEIWPKNIGTVWVITGAIPSPDGKRLHSGIGIPTAFYQIVAAQRGERLTAFAVYMPQTLRRRAYARSTLVSIDELERITGLDFLAELPDDVETALEAATPTRLWPTGMHGLYRLLRERFRSYD